MNKIFKDNKGVTLVEVIVVILIITIFSGIMISDFPRIRRQFAISRTVYRFSQDVRRVQNLALSGVFLEVDGIPVKTKGYGIYMNLVGNRKQYIIYADTQYADGKFSYTPGEYPYGDYIIEAAQVDTDSPDVSIDSLSGVGGSSVSIEFVPPNPTTVITPLLSDKDRVEIIFALDSDSTETRVVSVNKLGLIQIIK